MPQWDEAVVRITESIWSLSLELPCRPLAEGAPFEEARTLAGYIEISGAWSGVVELQCSLALARRATGVMFALEAAGAETELIHDTLGELANMMGGNLKALLPEPCRISLPAVVAAADCAPRRAGRRAVCRMVFDCTGEPLRVSLLEDAA